MILLSSVQPHILLFDTYCHPVSLLLPPTQVGRAPFVSAEDNQMELYQKILSGALFADLYATHPSLDP